MVQIIMDRPVSREDIHALHLHYKNLLSCVHTDFLNEIESCNMWLQDDFRLRLSSLRVLQNYREE